jgi:rare lipoprotein A
MALPSAIVHSRLPGTRVTALTLALTLCALQGCAIHAAKPPLDDAQDTGTHVSVTRSPHVRGSEPLQPPGTQTIHDQVVGIASYYGPRFHGRRTANGEPFDMNRLTAAHRALSFGTIVEVTNLANGRSVRVRVNDRGPYVPGRILDLSYGAAQRLGMIGSGLARVRIRVVSATD